MSAPMTARETLDRHFLDMRARLIDLGATLDRIGRAEGSAADDPRITQIHQALEILAAGSNDRAEKLQLLFSLPYDPRWQAD